MKNLLALLLMLLVVYAATPVMAQTKTDAEKIRSKVLRAGTGENARVTVKLKDGKKIKGYVTQAGNDNFVVRDSKTDTATTIAYTEVAKVETKRDKSALQSAVLGIAIGIGALFAVIGIVVAANN
jgi:small nuclear ribonucleoprotein (snRNP)-like protein